AEDAAPTIHDHDLSDLGPDEQAARIEGLAHTMSRQPFAFEHGPLMQLSLVALSPRERILLVRLPALCAASAALASLARELCGAYGACLGHERPAGEPMQYADVSEWQNELLESEDTETGR